MHSAQNDESWIRWAAAGAMPGSVFRGCSGDPPDHLLALIDRYEVYAHPPSSWCRLESDKTWLGHTITLCCTHAMEWAPGDNSFGCENLTHLLVTLAASMTPLERGGCRHGIAGFAIRSLAASAGVRCHHSLALELSHEFSAAPTRVQSEQECLEELEYRLQQLGILQIADGREDYR